MFFFETRCILGFLGMTFGKSRAGKNLVFVEKVFRVQLFRFLVFLGFNLGLRT